MKTSIIILNWNGKRHLRGCLASIARHTKSPHQIIVVDQGSKDGSVQFIEENYPAVKIIRNRQNVGIAKATNQAFRIAKNEYVYLLGNDTIVTDGWLESCIKIMESDRRIGCVASTLVPPGMLGRIVPEKRRFSKDNACSQGMLIRRKVLDRIGYYDENNFNPYGGEETDWNYLLRRAGYRILETKESIVGHIGGGDTKRQNPDRELLLNVGRLKAMLFNDSFFSFLKRLPGLALVFFNGLKSGTAKVILKSYYTNFQNRATIYRERQKRDELIGRLRQEQRLAGIDWF
ncbi:MAG: glycosyltransferase family 2 protein [Candidatus Aenigmarchaeota archaeon]|nr:glycosyltransferase family 2 protein [Candidatus Aenigmarchaeota archaeon]